MLLSLTHRSKLSLQSNVLLLFTRNLSLFLSILLLQALNLSSQLCHLTRGVPNAFKHVNLSALFGHNFRLILKLSFELLVSLLNRRVLLLSISQRRIVSFVDDFLLSGLLLLFRLLLFTELLSEGFDLNHQVLDLDVLGGLPQVDDLALLDSN
jgi:hypothetical protein